MGGDMAALASFLDAILSPMAAMLKFRPDEGHALFFRGASNARFR
jgi:hypothetical protein